MFFWTWSNQIIIWTSYIQKFWAICSHFYIYYLFIYFHLYFANKKRLVHTYVYSMDVNWLIFARVTVSICNYSYFFYVQEALFLHHFWIKIPRNLKILIIYWKYMLYMYMKYLMFCFNSSPPIITSRKSFVKFSADNYGSITSVHFIAL